MSRKLQALTNKDWAVFILRLAVGAIFLFHGTQKWVFWNGIPSEVPAVLGYIMLLLSVVEPLAAIGLIAGFQSALCALGLSIVMVCALTMKIIIYGQPFEAWELDLLLLASSASLLIDGPGSLSLEAKPMPTKKKR